MKIDENRHAMTWNELKHLDDEFKADLSQIVGAKAEDLTQYMDKVTGESKLQRDKITAQIW